MTFFQKQTVTGPFIKAVFGLALMLMSISGHTAILTMTLNDVAIGGETYDVTFHQDSDTSTSFNDVFGTGSPTLTFTTQADAFAAATALWNEADILNLDVTPADVGGINAFILPFDYTATTFDRFVGWVDDPVFDGVFGPFFDAARTDVSFGGSFVTFERTQAQVAEPATLALLLGGLGLLGLSRRRGQPIQLIAV